MIYGARGAWNAVRCGLCAGLLIMMTGAPAVAQDVPLLRPLVAALDAADKAAFLDRVETLAGEAPGPAYAAAVASGLAPWLADEAAVVALRALPPGVRAGRAPAVLAAVLVAVEGRLAGRVRDAVAAAVPGAPRKTLDALVARLSVQADGTIPLQAAPDLAPVLAEGQWAARTAARDLRVLAANTWETVRADGAVSGAAAAPRPEGRTTLDAAVPAEPLPRVPVHLLPSGS